MTSNENIDLNVAAREPGKGIAGRLRRDKYTPAIVYGTGVDPTSVSLEEKLVVKYATHEFENALFYYAL